MRRLLIDIRDFIEAEFTCREAGGVSDDDLALLERIEKRIAILDGAKAGMELLGYREPTV